MKAYVISPSPENGYITRSNKYLGFIRKTSILPQRGCPSLYSYRGCELLLAPKLAVF